MTRIKSLLKSESVDWSEVFSLMDYSESTYYVRLIETLIADGSEGEIAEVRQEPTKEERLEVRMNIVKHRGIPWLINHIKAFKEIAWNDSLVLYAKNIINLIELFMIGSMLANKKLPKNVKQFSCTLIKESEKKETALGFMNVQSKETYSKVEHTSSLEGNYLESFSELYEILKSELGLTLLNSIDLLDFAKDITGIIYKLVSLPSLVNEKYAFIEKLVLLLEAVLILDSKIYEPLSQTYDFAQIYLKEISIENSKAPRNGMQQLVYFVAANICPEDCEKIPLIQLLDSFLDPKVLLNSNSASNSLYELLPLLMNQYANLKIEKKTRAITKFKEIVQYLQSYTSTEILHSSRVDAFLLGLLKIASKLLLMNTFNDRFGVEESIELINKVISRCLFPNEKGEYLCKTEQTREVAYEIVSLLAEQKVTCWIHIIRDYMLPLRERVTELSSWLVSPINYERSSLGCVGLKNLGCICYINSMLQQFFMVSPFRNAILTVSDEILPSFTKEGIDDNLLHQFQRTFAYLLASNRREFNPAAFCYSFKEIDGKPTNTAIQHDAHEFLNILFERLERTFKETPYKWLIQHIFAGKSCSQIICSNCGFVSSTYEDFYTLSLEIKNQRNLDDSLERFIADSTVSDYRCSNCNKKADVTKHTLISALPNVLIIHLQRFTYNFDLFMNEKIHTRLEFPSALDMTKYTEEGRANRMEDKESRKISRLSNDNEASLTNKIVDFVEQEGKEIEDAKSRLTERQEKKPLKEKEYYSYKLVGIVMHNGNAEAGHYYSYININRGIDKNLDKDQWLEFNDSTISPFNLTGIETECFGGSLDDMSMSYMDDNIEMTKLIGGRSKSAYMLVYERERKSMIPLRVEPASVTGEDLVLDSLECDGTAISRAEKCGARVFGKCSDGVYLFHKYYEVPFSLPSEVATEVARDNEVFLYEQLIYEKNFTSFVSETCKLSIITYNCVNLDLLKNELRTLLCIFIEKFIFEIQAHIASIPIIFSDYIYQSIHDIFATESVQGRMFITKFMSKPERLLGFLVKCPEQQIRTCFKMALLGSFNGIKNDDKLKVDFIDFLINCINHELTLQWTKFKEFFELLREIMMSLNEDLLEYCIKKNLIATLLDFFLEQSSPLSPPQSKSNEMRSSTQVPDFNTLMETVAYLVIHCDMPIPHKGIITPPTKAGTLSVSPPELSMMCLMCKETLRKYLKHSDKPEIITRMALHLAYQNKKITHYLCELILKGMNNYDETKVISHFDILAKTLSLKDEYSQLRVELLLGFAQPATQNYFGLAGVISIEDTVNMYLSSAETEEGNKSLLHLLWNDRRRSDKVVVQLLNLLFILAETNQELYQYLRDVPPPCYLYTRYFDWVSKFLDTYCKDYSYLTAERIKEKEELALRLKDLYKKFTERVAKDGVQPPQLYMIGKTISVNPLKDKERTLNDVKLTVSEIKVEVYESKPMNDYNAAMAGDYLICYFNHAINNANSKHEQKVLEQSKFKDIKEEAMSKETKKVNEDKKTIMLDCAEDLTVEKVETDKNYSNKFDIEKMDSNVDTKPHDKQNMEVSNNKDKEINEVQMKDIEERTETKKAEEVIKEDDRMLLEEIPESKEEDFTSNQIKQKKNVRFLTDSNEEIRASEPKIMITSSFNASWEGSEIPLAKSELKGNDIPKYKEVVIFHKIVIVKFSYNRIVASISLIPKGPSTNFYCPVSKCKCKVSKSESTVFVAQVNDISKPLGDYEIKLKVKNLDTPIISLQRCEQAGAAGKIETFQPSIDNTDSNKKEKICLACTFLNSINAEFCELCRGYTFKDEL